MDEGTYLGEFRRGPAIFTVFRTAQAPACYRVTCSDGNGPSEVCVFTDRPGSGPQWHGAWNGDEWCGWIEAEARTIVQKLPARVRRPTVVVHGLLQRCRARRPDRPDAGHPRPRHGAAGTGRSGGDRPVRPGPGALRSAPGPLRHPYSMTAR
ncbi:hypothetical protein GCM10028833_18690 [Glycomyces tarimensis]